MARIWLGTPRDDGRSEPPPGWLGRPDDEAVDDNVDRPRRSCRQAWDELRRRLSPRRGR